MKHGFTVMELVVSIAIFGLIMVVSVVALNQSRWIMHTTSGRDAAMRELVKACKAIQDDLELTRAAPDTLQQARVPATLGGGSDGDAVDFLSPVDPAVQKAMYQPDGSVFWMRNITYYVVVPSDHDQRAGFACSGAPDAQGYDDACPHKILVRQVQDQNGSDPANPATQQALLSPFSSFPRLPLNTATATLKTVAINLLTFRCQRQNNAVLVDLRAASIEDAVKEVQVGSVPLSSTRFVIRESWQVFPKN